MSPGDIFVNHYGIFIFAGFKNNEYISECLYEFKEEKENRRTPYNRILPKEDRRPSMYTQVFKGNYWYMACPEHMTLVNWDDLENPEQILPLLTSDDKQSRDLGLGILRELTLLK